MKRLIYVAASLAFMSATAAQERSGGYMGFSLGSFTYEEEDEELGITVIDDSTSAYRLVGGYRFSDNFAVEGGWGKTGDLKDGFTEFVPGVGDVTFNVSGEYEVLTVRALGIVPFDKLSLVGGIGYYDTELDAELSVTGVGSFDFEGSDDGATLIGGLEFNLERVNIRAELEWFDTDDEVSAWDFSVGVLFRL